LREHHSGDQKEKREYPGHRSYAPQHKTLDDFGTDCKSHSDRSGDLAAPVERGDHDGPGERDDEVLTGLIWNDALHATDTYYMSKKSLPEFEKLAAMESGYAWRPITVRRAGGQLNLLYRPHQCPDDAIARARYVGLCKRASRKLALRNEVRKCPSHLRILKSPSHGGRLRYAAPGGIDGQTEDSGSRDR